MDRIQGDRFRLPGGFHRSGLISSTRNHDVTTIAANAPIVILAVSNFGYILAHVLAISAFIMLPRRQPGLARPFKLSSYWLPLAYFLLIFNIVIIPLGAANPSLGYGVVPFLLGVVVLLISVVLYYVRRYVEDPRAARAAAAARA